MLKKENTEKENVINFMNNSIISTIRNYDPHIFTKLNAHNIICKKLILTFNIEIGNIKIVYIEKDDTYNITLSNIINNKTNIISKVNVKKDEIFKTLKSMAGV